MKNFKILIAVAAVSAGLSLAFAPQPAKAQSIVDIARVIVNANDIVYRGNVPYYRYGSYRPQDRIIVVREGGHRKYYRQAPRGVAHGYYGTQPGHHKNKAYKARAKAYKKYRKQQAKRYHH